MSYLSPVTSTAIALRGGRFHLWRLLIQHRVIEIDPLSAFFAFPSRSRGRSAANARGRPAARRIKIR
ncbi:hypothetical protein A5676_15640 [Mycobacterium malmoense]|nr:hypothetical protein A5676_15640 [Mycobacterium malmoense]